MGRAIQCFNAVTVVDGSGVAYSTPIISPTRLPQGVAVQDWRELHFEVHCNVGAGAEVMTFSVEASVDGVTWATVPVRALTGAGNFADSVAVTADTDKVLFRLEGWFAQWRVKAANTGATDAVLTMYAHMH